MSKRNNKRTRSQRKAARFIETLRRNGGIEGVEEVDLRVTKYVLLQEGRDGAVGPVRRIMAVRPGPWGPAGTAGGFVGSEANLSHEGDCWIYDNAEVSENARVSGNAQVRDDATGLGKRPDRGQLPRAWRFSRLRQGVRIRLRRDRRRRHTGQRPRQGRGRPW